MSNYKYINVELFNNTPQPVPAIYSVNYVQPIVIDSHNYKFACVRFSLPSTLLPLFLFQNNSYYVTLSHNGSDFTSVVNYVSHSPISVYPQPVFHYQEFLTMINTAYTQSFNNLITTFPGLVTLAPYLSYDATTELCTFWVPIDYVVNTVSVFMNSNLYSFFNNFNVQVYGYNLPTRKDVQLLVQNNNNNTNGSYYTFPQEYTALYYFNDLRKIIFVTATNISSEVNSVNINDFSGQTLWTPSLTDFEIVLSGDTSNYQGTIQYQPGGTLYRYIDINTNEPFRKFDLRVQVEYRDGSHYDLYIEPGEIVSCKFLLERKQIL